MRREPIPRDSSLQDPAKALGSALRGAAREIPLRSGWIVRNALAAAALAVAMTAALPWTWESTAVLLPSDRRTDEFHYRNSRTGLARFLESFRLVDRTHPEEVDRAILTGAESARRLVERLDLQRRWKSKSMEDATIQLARSLDVELVPYGPLRVKAQTSDRQLSADLANESAKLLEERLDELHLALVEAERGFLTDAIRDELADAVAEEARLAEFQTLYGVGNADVERRIETAWAVERATALATARLRGAEAARRFGVGSANAADEERRTEALRAAEASVVSSAASRPQQDLLESDVRRAERIARLLGALRGQTWAQEAQRMGDARLLDTARPAAMPNLRPFVLAALLAAGAIPLGALGGLAARRSVPRSLPFVVAAAAGAVLLTREPILGAGLLVLLFLATLVVHVPTAWLVLIAALPWAWNYVDAQRGFSVQIPTEPGIFALAGAWAYALALRGGARVPRSRILLAALLTFAWTMAATITTVHPKHSIFQVVSVGGFILAGALFPMFEIRDLASVRRVLHVTIFSGVALSLFGIVQVVSSPLALDRAAFFMGDVFLDSHGPYSAVLGFALGPTLVLLLTERERRFTWGIAFGVILAAIVISLARAAWISVACLFAIVGIIRFRSFVRTIAPALLVLAIGIPLFLVVTRAAPTFQSFVTKSVDPKYGSNVERINRWRAGLAMVRDRPFLGVGPGAYEDAYPNYRDAAFVTPQSDERMGAHSDLVRTAAEQGIPGVVVLLFLVAATFRAAIRLARRSPSPEIQRLAVAIAAGLFTYTIHGLFNEYWRVTKVAFLMWVFVGLLGALEQIDHRLVRGRAEGGLSPKGSPS